MSYLLQILIIISLLYTAYCIEKIYLFLVDWKSDWDNGNVFDENNNEDIVP